VALLGVGQRAKGMGQRALGIGQRALGIGHWAKGKGQRAKGMGERGKKRSLLFPLTFPLFPRRCHPPHLPSQPSTINRQPSTTSI